MSETFEGVGANAVPRTDAELDRAMLARTIELAELGRTGARPNPVVGAVLARSDGTILATGHHPRRGEAHAERFCLADAPADIPEDATLFVSLEPCNHTGAQPPCSEHVLERGVRRLVFACCDPNPETAGMGPAALIAGGVEVLRGPKDIERAALQQNAGFHSVHLRGRAYVTAKFAMTRNGRFATGDPQRRWISGEESRAFVQYMRAGSGAVAVGIGTVLADDPLLTVRGALADRTPVPPLRVVYDRRLQLPLDAQLVRTLDHGPVLAVCCHDAPAANELALLDAGVQVWRAPEPEPGAPCLPAASLSMLARDHRINDVLIEAGPRLLDVFHDAELIDAVTAFVAPVEAPADEPGLDLDHGLVSTALAAPGDASGADQRHVALIHPAWQFPGAQPG